MTFGFYHLSKKSIILLNVITLSLLLSACQSTDNKQEAPLSSPVSAKTTKLNLIVFGDALLHGAIYKDAFERHDDYYFDDMFDELKPIIDGYDLAFYNQETILGGTTLGLSSYPRFNGPQEWGDTMMRLGFNLVNLASNHTLDYGEQGVLKSLDYWDNQTALTAGSYRNHQQRAALDRRVKHDISYTLLAYTYGTNGILIPKGKEYLVNVYTKEMLIEDVTKARDQVDFLMVSMHWGNEYQHEISDEQQEISELLADLGVDLIIGSHVHVIQPVTWIDDTLVYYGLGNMISAQKGVERLTGAFGSMEIQKTTTPDGRSSIKIVDPKVDLIYTHYNSAYRQIKLYPYTALTEDLLKNHSMHYDYFSSILTSLDDRIKIGQTK